VFLEVLFLFKNNYLASLSRRLSPCVFWGFVPFLKRFGFTSMNTLPLCFLGSCFLFKTFWLLFREDLTHIFLRILFLF
jgi:hypothetical protein